MGLSPARHFRALLGDSGKCRLSSGAKEAKVTKSNKKNDEAISRAQEPVTAKGKSAKSTKTETLLKLLKSKRGATIGQLQKASGWQAHSVRGFLSGTVSKRMGLQLTREPDGKGERRYRVSGAVKQGAS